MRGEKLFVDGFERHGAGSPPHARGKVIAVIIGKSSEGITPACAGKSSPDWEVPAFD